MIYTTVEDALRHNQKRFLELYKEEKAISHFRFQERLLRPPFYSYETGRLNEQAQYSALDRLNQERDTNDSRHKDTEENCSG